MSQLSVNNLSLALAFALVLVAVYISNREKLGLTKDIFYSISLGRGRRGAGEDAVVDADA